MFDLIYEQNFSSYLKEDGIEHKPCFFIYSNSLFIEVFTDFDVIVISKSIFYTPCDWQSSLQSRDSKSKFDASFLLNQITHEIIFIVAKYSRFSIYYVMCLKDATKVLLQWWRRGDMHRWMERIDPKRWIEPL